MSTTYTGDFKAPIFLKKSDYDALTTKDTFQEYVFTDVRALEIQTGSTDPTTATSDEQGNVYQNTTTGDMFFLRSITGSTTYNWEKIIGPSNVATTSANGAMSSSDKTKLDGIETGAEVNDVTSVDGETGAVVLNDVKYTTQTLTDSQKSIARNNIGAWTATEYDGTASSYDDGVFYWVAESEA